MRGIVREETRTAVIDRAYKARTLQIHPDKGGSNEAMAGAVAVARCMRANAGRRCIGTVVS